MVGLVLHPGRAAAVHHFRRIRRHGAGDLRLRVRVGPRRPHRDLEDFVPAGAGHHGVWLRPVFLCAARSVSDHPWGASVIGQALTDLWYGFGVALEPHNLLWCFVGVLIGNIAGVLPGLGPPATISILLPLTFGIKPVGAILTPAGVMYGAQYGGAICSILLNLPCHPPHAVTCLDGYPMTKQGRGGGGR